MATLYSTDSNADGSPTLMICERTVLLESLSGFFPAFTRVQEKKITIARLITLDMTVAVATPCTPLCSAKRKTAFKAKFTRLPIMVAMRGCFVCPNALR